ncbi:MAG: DUF4145 domain-containing protein [Pseudomonadaceae bacterium]|nr:DUF4145 domain-containing protein [Pseudomonadaceae bacterium]
MGIFPHRWDPKNATGLLQNVPGIAIQKELPEPANNSAPPFTPDRIAGIFKQAVSSLENGNFDAAGAMTRKCLDIATKYVTNGDKRYENLWLKARIEQMTDDHLLTPELGVWAGIIREDGNSAVHDEVEFGKEEAQEMVDFTEVFLNYVFTIPGKIEDRAVTEKVKAQLSGLKAEVRALTEKIED